jgi:DNA-binding transcriptional LysR family regulator
MDLEHIAAFLALADTVSFSNAAKKLGISQSTLSKHIKQLESSLGGPLFTRTKRNVSLTPLGTLFLEYARRFAQIQQAYTTALQQQSSLTNRVLRIGVFPMMMYYNIMDLLDLFQERYPDISIEIVEDETDRLLDLMAQHRLEFAFLREIDQQETDAFQRETFATDTLAVVLPASHPLAKREHISIEQLAGDSFLLLPQNSMIHKLCLRLFAAAELHPNIAYTGSGENIFNLVSNGVGVSLLTKRPAAFLANPNCSIVDLAPPVTSYIDLCYPNLSQFSSASELFLNFYHSLHPR